MAIPGLSETDAILTIEAKEGDFFVLGMTGREHLGQMSSTRSSWRRSRSLEPARQPDEVDLHKLIGTPATRQDAADEDGEALLPRLRHARQAGREKGRYPTLQVTLRPWLWFADPAKNSRSSRRRRVKDDHQRGARATTTRRRRLEARQRGRLREARLLRAVQRDRLRLHQPADGGGRHLLLLRARGRRAHDGASSTRSASTSRIQVERPDQLGATRCSTEPTITRLARAGGGAHGQDRAHRLRLPRPDDQDRGRRARPTTAARRARRDGVVRVSGAASCRTASRRDPTSARRAIERACDGADARS